MESFFGSLKTELDDDGPFETRQAARMALFRFAGHRGLPQSPAPPFGPGLHHPC